MLIALLEDGVDLLWKLFNKIYETGLIPPDKLKSVFIAIPKTLTFWNVKTTEPSINVAYSETVTENHISTHKKKTSTPNASLSIWFYAKQRHRECNFCFAHAV